MQEANMIKFFPVLILVVLMIVVSSQGAMAAPGLQGGGVIHYVAVGENLTSIAAQYGVSVEAIMQHNGLANPNMIYVGQPLVIPTGYGGYPGGPGGCSRYHTVRMGETLSGIAWQYNVSIHDLARCNNLYDQDMVQLGQTLCIPGGTAYAAPPITYQGPPSPGAYYHAVTAGETLSGIASRYGVDAWSIAQANNLRDSSYIWVGQQLAIPGYQPQAYRPAPPPPPVYPQAPPPDYAYAPAPKYDQAPPDYAYAPAPKYDQPPAAPKYTGGYDGGPAYSPPGKPAYSGKTPPAPEYQPDRASVELPRTETPLLIEVNGGETWADEIFSRPDPNGITTLLVQTGDELGKQVRVRSGDYEVKGESEFSAEFGANRFIFRYIPAGDYDVWIDDPETPSEVVRVKVDAGQRVDVFFSKQVRFQGQTFASADGWYLADWKNPSKPGQNIGGWSNILVKTPASGLNVLIESEGGGYQAKCFTGSKGPGACDFAGLMAGIYYIWIDGTDLKLKTYMDGAAYAEFTFARQ
jgi:LysM repeat protein